MQTFLPSPDFHQSGMTLDQSRIGNQMWRECWTLVHGGWPNHPASIMWRGHEYALCDYALALCDVLYDRFMAGQHWCKFSTILSWRQKWTDMREVFPDTGVPAWLGDERVHSSHRAVLLWKDADWYGQFGWQETPKGPGPDGKYPYYWPV